MQVVVRMHARRAGECIALHHCVCVCVRACRMHTMQFATNGEGRRWQWLQRRDHRVGDSCAAGVKLWIGAWMGLGHSFTLWLCICELLKMCGMALMLGVFIDLTLFWLVDVEGSAGEDKPGKIPGAHALVGGNIGCCVFALAAAEGDKVDCEELLGKKYAWWCTWLGHASKTAGDGWVQVVQLLDQNHRRPSVHLEAPSPPTHPHSKTNLSLCLCPFAQERTPR